MGTIKDFFYYFTERVYLALFLPFSLEFWNMLILTIGLAFGMDAIRSVALGSLIDAFSLTSIMIHISVLPVLGTLAYLLPSDQTLRKWHQ